MKRPALAALLVAVVASPMPGHADEGAMKVRAGLAQIRYRSPNAEPLAPDVESSYRALTLGASYVAPNGWFADIGWHRSLAAKWNTQEAFPGTVGDDGFSRRETTLTLGKALGYGIAVFGGVQIARSELTFSPANTIFSSDEDLLLESRLWFAGVSKALSIPGPGSLSISGALGVLRQQIRWSANFKEVGRVDEKSDSGFAFSLGAAYTYPVTGNISAVADLRFQSAKVKYTASASNEEAVALGISLVGQF